MPYAPKPPLWRAADAGKRAISHSEQRATTATEDVNRQRSIETSSSAALIAMHHTPSKLVLRVTGWGC